MRIRNVHERELPPTSLLLGTLIDGLASPCDRLWPCGDWPAMCFDRPLTVGVDDGDGPIRYSVEAYEPGRLVRFHFNAPRGLEGRHHFEVTAARLVFRPLHDALLEDARDRAERARNREPARPARWSRRVQLLRRLLGRPRSRPLVRSTR